MELSNKPVVLDARVVIGDSFYHTLTFKNGDGTYIDFTGASAKAIVRESPDSTSTAILTMSSAGSPIYITLDAAVENNFIINVPKTVTADLTAGVYYWDMEITDSSGKTRTYWKGRFVVEEQITL